MLTLTNRRPDAEVAQEHGVESLSELFIGVPHQRPPYLATVAHDGEPLRQLGDRCVEGDHDLNSIYSIPEWIDILNTPHLAARQHQRFAIEALIEKTLCAPAE